MPPAPKEKKGPVAGHGKWTSSARLYWPQFLEAPPQLEPPNMVNGATGRQLIAVKSLNCCVYLGQEQTCRNSHNNGQMPQNECKMKQHRFLIAWDSWHRISPNCLSFPLISRFTCEFTAFHMGVGLYSCKTHVDFSVRATGS